MRFLLKYHKIWQHWIQEPLELGGGRPCTWENMLFCSHNSCYSFLSHSEPASLICITCCSFKAIDLQSLI